MKLARTGTREICISGFVLPKDAHFLLPLRRLKLGRILKQRAICTVMDLQKNLIGKERATSHLG